MDPVLEQEPDPAGGKFYVGHSSTLRLYPLRRMNFTTMEYLIYNENYNFVLYEIVLIDLICLNYESFNIIKEIH